MSSHLSAAAAERVFVDKYGPLDKHGWAPRRRFRFKFFLPAEVYEATVSGLVSDGCSWIDVGGGRTIFPHNPKLARQLVSRCSNVVAVDPSGNVHENPFVHERVQSFIEDYRTDRQFDVATLRMVVEHVEQPDRVVASLHRLLKPGGVAVVLTVNKWSPITLLSKVMPFGLHHPLKSFAWGGDEKDTFPVRYLMNTRRQLREHFTSHGFREAQFAYLDDLSAFGKFNLPNLVELSVWKALRAVGIRYPENNLLGIYQRLP